MFLMKPPSPIPLLFPGRLNVSLGLFDQIFQKIVKPAVSKTMLCTNCLFFNISHNFGPRFGQEKVGAFCFSTFWHLMKLELKFTYLSSINSVDDIVNISAFFLLENPLWSLNYTLITRSMWCLFFIKSYHSAKFSISPYGELRRLDFQ